MIRSPFSDLFNVMPVPADHDFDDLISRLDTADARLGEIADELGALSTSSVIHEPTVIRTIRQSIAYRIGIIFIALRGWFKLGTGPCIGLSTPVSNAKAATKP